MWHKAIVVSGKGRGKFLGFPTLNLTIPSDIAIQPGIYAGWVNIGGKVYQGAFHFGPILTFNQAETAFEVFVIDQQLEATPNTIQFQLLDNIRPPEKFATPQALIDQMTRDVEQIKIILSRLTPPSV